MGGHRCSYRNCAVRSDGKIHMFHYPVFDKVRCHQWLSNAQKVEFLNLKVSQLKNRVVCQHHFKNECFMNFKKDKLTFDAVPTENGPYCNSKSEDIEVPKILNTISLDDIENEYLTCNDKKANYSVKYGDFLTNGDLTDLEPTSQNTGIVTLRVNDNNLAVTNPQRKAASVNFYTHQIKQHTENNTTNTKDSFSSLIANAPVYIENNDVDKSLFEVPIINFGDANLYTSAATTLNNDTNIVINCVPEDNNTLLVERPHSIPYNASEITDVQRNENPLKVTVVSVDFDENPNQQRNLDQLSNLNSDFNQVVDHKSNVKLELSQVVGQNINQAVDQKLKAQNLIGSNKNNLNSNQSVLKPRQKIQILSEEITEPVVIGTLEPVSPSGLLPLPKKTRFRTPISRGKQMKKKISAERKAAIQEKRKFNMKLRDIIESCLDKLDGDDERNYNKNMKENSIGSEKVSTYLSKDSELSNVHEYTIAYLESRIQKMENNLLNKIDTNSQRILELKQTIVPPSVKKTIHTQTVTNEEAHKKQLYQEISKYLSPDANNLVYEELFINKYTQKTTKPSPKTKRRKIR